MSIFGRRFLPALGAAFAAVGFSAIVAVPRVARAQSPAPTPAPAAPAPPPDAAPAYTLDVDSDDRDVVSFESLAARLESELGAPVVRADGVAATRAAIAVRYRAHDRETRVRVTHAGGRVLERTVMASRDGAQAQSEAVLLASNLARDEARELLDAMAAKHPPPPPAPTPTPSPQVAPPPAAPAATPAPQPEEPTHRVLVTGGIFFPASTNSEDPNVGTALDLSLVYNRVGWVDGAQIGAGAAYVGHRLRGAQIAGGASLAGELHGAQISGAFNVAGRVDGVQIASALNVARDTTGVQLGLVNVSRHVHGFQLGLVNVAEDSDGSIGLVSLTKNGVHPVAWTSTGGYANVGVRFRSHCLYTTLAATWGSRDNGFDDAGVVVALGMQYFRWRLLGLGAEVAHTSVRDLRDANAQGHSSVTPRVLLQLAIAPRFQVFVGGGAQVPYKPIGTPKAWPEVFAGIEL